MTVPFCRSRGLPVKSTTNPLFGKDGKPVRHNLNIRVSDKPQNGGVVACRTVSIREKLFTLLLGPKQRVMVVVAGNSVESIAIIEVPMGGGVHE